MNIDVTFRKTINTFNVNVKGCNNIHEDVFIVPFESNNRSWCLRIAPKRWSIELGHKGTTTASYEITVTHNLKRLLTFKIPLAKFTTNFRNLNNTNSYVYPEDCQLVTPLAKPMQNFENLQIVVRIELYHPMEQTFRGPIEPFAKGSELGVHIADLSLSNSWTDVSIVGANGEAILAHKLILCARSSVFKAMFSNGMKESLSDVVNIPDIDTAVLRDMLMYVYTDRCPQETLQKHAEPLLAAACKYQLKGLESICAVYLSTVITVENATKIFHLADALNSEQLKSFAEKFLRDQRLTI